VPNNQAERHLSSLPTKIKGSFAENRLIGRAETDANTEVFIVLFPTCAVCRERLIALTSMIHHIVLYKLKPEVTPARVEEMMMNTRMQLLKIPEVLNIKCGKRVDPELPWPFFIAIDFESMDKFAIFREDPIFVKFMEEIIKPNTADSLSLDFEMDPGKDVRFS
jgi:hypothetical protein